MIDRGGQREPLEATDLRPGLRTIRRRRRAITVGWIAILALCFGVGSYSLAIFVGHDAANAQFSSGTITLGPSPTAAVISASNMLPGNSVAATLTIMNPSPVTVRYAMTAAATNVDGKGLAAALNLAIERGTLCAGPVVETPYSGAIGSALIGDPRPGADPGDRTLAPGGSETLCFRASLPSDLDPLVGNAATTVTFTFWSEQTANNP